MTKGMHFRSLLLNSYFLSEFYRKVHVRKPQLACRPAGKGRFQVLIRLVMSLMGFRNEFGMT